tara:strand:- start:1500 stop:9023 length:7524 start_codon:yes stop_codon:yes gene_type:complete
MPQQTNLNVSPYFDDYSDNSGYHKVLFKPGTPVQARELNNLQSILQNQIEKFGQHFFKEGAKVIPGNTGYNKLYYNIQLQNNFQGVPVSAYVDQLVGTQITGRTSGVTAVVDNILLAEDSERGNLTLYVAYISSSTSNNATQTFADGEDLTCNVPINSGLLGNSTISAGTPFATTIAQNAAATGSCFQIQEGVYFIRGQFVKVEKQTLILEQYNSNGNYRVGLAVNEEIINSDMDETLNDNSQGFNNFAAPGADRLKITLSLFKKPLDDFDDNAFVEEAEVVDGVLKSKIQTSTYKNLADEMAQRSYDQAGDYYVKPFTVGVKDSLNDNIGNRGLFQEGQFTYSGTTPSDDLACYKISPGKAYVRGYGIEVPNPVYLDCPKPRTTKTLSNQNIIYNTGATLKLNRTFGNPTIGIGNTYILSLRDQRVGADQTVVPGTEIGVARVYDYSLETGSYNINSVLNQWDLSLFDVQTVTQVTLNQPIDSLPTPTFIKGANSGATAFLKDSVTNSAALNLYEREGDFIENEALIFNGIQNGRVATAITAYTISDVKSVFATNDGTVGTAGTFNGDVIQSPSIFVGVATVTAASGGVSTVTHGNGDLFPGSGLVKVNNLVQFSNPAKSNDPTYGRITVVGDTSITIANVADVDGIVNGSLPTVARDVTDLQVLTTNLSASSDNTLFTRLPKDYISDVDLTNASLSIRKVFEVNIVDNRLSQPVSAGSSEFFLPFDEERYSLIRVDGTAEPLTTDKFEISLDGKTLQIYNLGGDDAGAQLTTTLTKQNPRAKKKIKNRVNSLIVDKSTNSASGIGSTTINDGLTFGAFPFGTRVQDNLLSLNSPDVMKIHGIFESADLEVPSAPKMVLSDINSQSTTTTELIIGEYLTGQNSGAIACYAERLSDSQITFIYKNDFVFAEGETVIFKESGIQGVVTTLESNSFDIGGEYTFSTGQEKTIYDYGTISRKPEAEAPNKKIKVYFENAFYDSTDDGDITTINSYETFDYGNDIMGVDGICNCDIIDIRPRVADYTVSESSRSPLEFFGRTFNNVGQTATNILASDEAIVASFSFYLGRIDRIYLTKEGVFQVKYGVPAEKPDKPGTVDGALEIATINLPPYFFNPQQADIRAQEYKRFRMVDIKNLENRIKNLEYYTALTLLETNTANLFVSDADGLNRFKSGFFVDNFDSFLPQEDRLGIKNSIDRSFKELRPKHYTNSVDLIFGPVTDVDPSVDLAFNTIEGINVRKNNDTVTLDYADVEWLKQSFATRTESVTPFLISFWQGTVELTPASDNWVDTVKLEAKVIQTEGNYAETMAAASRNFGTDPQTGFAPVLWNAWQTNWTGVDTVDTSRITQHGGEWGPRFSRGGWPNGDPSTNPARWIQARQTTTIREEIRETIQRGVESRQGVRTIVSEVFDRQSQGTKVVNRDIIPYMRSRNIEFVSKRMKPITQLYAFFDGEDVTKYCTPKLLEIEMSSGTFQVGETVIGNIQGTGLGGDNFSSMRPSITFRVAQSNHKEGQYNAPSVTYASSPYTQKPVPASYTSTSTTLNVDTYSLQNEVQGEFHGYVESGMILTGKTSGAQAKITNVRLISDLSAFCAGTYFIPNPNGVNFPRFETGSSVFTLVSDKDNNHNEAVTIAEEQYTAAGALETVQETIISVRNARVEQKQEFQQRNVNRLLGSEIVSTNVSAGPLEERDVGWFDPLAQSFLVEEETGVFLTKCDIFFRTKDDMDIPVVFQLRTMQGGFPTQKVLPFSEIVLNPDQVNISGDGSVATTIQFKSPVYLENGGEYAICLASNSTKYSVYISRIGEEDLLTNTFISNQPYLGSLFKSQNASTWEPSQWEDLKFTLYRADFIESGTVEFYNPDLTEGNNQIPILMPNSLSLKSKEVRVGLGTTVFDGNLEIGNTVYQMATQATGNLVGTAGTAAGPNLTVTDAGIGYTPASDQTTYSGVNLITITGNGRGAVGSVTINNGSIVAGGATITGGGSGYQIGDVVGINTLGSTSVGRNARLTITSIGATSELVLNEVQGNFVVGAANTVMFIDSDTQVRELNSENGGDVQISSINQNNDGLHIKVNHKNHGMYFSDNKVEISGVQSDIKPTKLTAAYTATSTSPLSVVKAEDFEEFENVGVGTTNTGFLRIGNEIIEYTSVADNTIGGTIVRGENPVSYPVGTPVFKYELADVNLRRINKTHNLSDVTKEDHITFDSYEIKVDMSEKFNVNNDDRSNDVGFPQLFVGQTKSAGGYDIRATQNMPFEIITPVVQNLSVKGTSLTGEVRTTTSKSIDGNEIPYLDAGYESIALNEANYLDSPRLIASKVNANAKLSTLPGEKSMNMRLFLNTTDSRISPVIDSQRVSTILTSNRVNDVIDDYTTDPRANSLVDDPTACQYLSKEINLENPGTSIKILLGAHIHLESDIRAFYAVSDKQGFKPIFTPFPGFKNLNNQGQIIDPKNNDGQSDALVVKSNSYGFEPQDIEYKDYTFTADNLPSFRSYRIKIVLTSKNQAYVPRIKDLRVLALA